MALAIVREAELLPFGEGRPERFRPFGACLSQWGGLVGWPASMSSGQESWGIVYPAVGDPAGLEMHTPQELGVVRVLGTLKAPSDLFYGPGGGSGLQGQAELQSPQHSLQEPISWACL